MRIASCLVCLSLLCAASGCSLDKKVSSEAKQRAQEHQRAKHERHAVAAPSSKAATDRDPGQAVILVEGIYGGRTTRATGVIFDAAAGLALTAAHPVEGAPAVIATLADGTPRRARVVARAQCHDLAVLRLTPAPARVRPIPFAPSGAVRIGEPVRALTYASQAAGSGSPQLTLTHGTVTALNVRERFVPLPPISSLIAHETPLGPVASGSPLLNERGQLIGINTLVAHPRVPAQPGVEYALSSDYIRRRLRELKPGPNGTLGGWRAEHDACHHALNQLIATGHTHG
jgi:S1-C subfamily serine protease